MRQGSQKGRCSKAEHPGCQKKRKKKENINIFLIPGRDPLRCHIHPDRRVPPLCPPGGGAGLQAQAAQEARQEEEPRRGRGRGLPRQWNVSVEKYRSISHCQSENKRF